MENSLPQVGQVQQMMVEVQDLGLEGLELDLFEVEKKVYDLGKGNETLVGEAVGVEEPQMNV